MFGNHLAGIYEKALDPSDSWERRLRKAKSLGFDFLEISIDESDERLERLYWPREEIEGLRRLSSAEEMPIRSMCLSGHRRFPFGSADAAVREKAYDIMDRAIDFACAAGIRVIQLAGYDVYYEPSTPESVRRFREGMCWAVRRAARSQVMLAMEIMDTAFMNSITKHMGYEAMLHSPWYKVYPDIGNLSAWGENDPIEELSRGLDSIVAVHVKDTLPVSADSAGKFKGVPFGSGCVDFAGAFARLEELGYAGPYMIEMWYEPGTDDMERISAAQSWLERQFQAALAKTSEARKGAAT